MGERKVTILSSYGEVHNTGQGTGMAFVGIRVPAQTHNPDRLLRSVAWGVATRNGHRKLSPVGPIDTVPDAETDTVWHRAVYNIGR